jgi:hypothetical protein
VIVELNYQAVTSENQYVTLALWFAEAWVQVDACVDIVTEAAWNETFDKEGLSVNETLTKIGSTLWCWDNEVLAELKKRIKDAKRDLEECRKGTITQENF